VPLDFSYASDLKLTGYDLVLLRMSILIMRDARGRAKQAQTA
jgi:hypothetical protein